MNSFWRSWKAKKPLLLSPTRKFSSLMMRKETWRTRFPNFRGSATRAKPSINNYAKLSKTLLAKTKILPPNSKLFRIQWESVRESWINPPSKERTSEKTTCSLQTKTKSSTVRSTNVCWASSSMSASTRICKKKSRITSNVTNRPETCWIGKRPWEVYWTKWRTNSTKPKNKSPISVDHHTIIS